MALINMRSEGLVSNLHDLLFIFIVNNFLGKWVDNHS